MNFKDTQILPYMLRNIFHDVHTSPNEMYRNGSVFRKIMSKEKISDEELVEDITTILRTPLLNRNSLIENLREKCLNLK